MLRDGRINSDSTRHVHNSIHDSSQPSSSGHTEQARPTAEYNISELHENLTILLEKKTFLVSMVDICEVVRELVDIYSGSYPKIDFQITKNSLVVEINKNAIKQVLNNLIENACKYNIDNGYVKIYEKNNSLIIENSGKKIEEPQKIFERSYSAQNSSGYGLDIVKRLCDAMHVGINLTSSSQSTTFSLEFITPPTNKLSF